MYTKEEFGDLIGKAVAGLPFDEEAVRLLEPVRYIMSMGGKRLRPLMTLMACSLYSDKPLDALMPAVGLEVFHNFTLVHDDIMDNAQVRRNFATVHEKWNINQAILSGDVMAFIANEYIAQSPAESMARVFRLYNRTAIEVCKGQQLDMDFEKRKIVSEDEYLRMIELKTAVLIAASLKTGALIGGAPDREAELMYEFGRNLGLAFQVQDDILDVYGDSALFGKKQGGDIISNKKTLLLIKAMELSEGETNRRLVEQLSLREFDPDNKIAVVMGIYDELGVREKCESLANEFIEKALSYFREINVPQARKEPLLQLAMGLTGRDR
ncbi:MAG: polyprenyl synthetase family protein [Bacteroidales bacterium]|jgi:geranylgeranyl diphosphate synthase type II|nr:polyprenyl synthetase family protein [Bacteroidales bacterium]